MTFVGNTTTLGTVEASDIKQVNHYYPFGMNMEGPAYSFSGANKYQYNEKELNTDFGLNWNDYGARWYDASIGRWLAVDPLAEMYGNMSPYHYGMNNPIKYVDPTGMASEAYSFGTSGSSGAAYEAYKRAEDRITGRDHGEVDQSDIAGTYSPYGTRTYSKGQLIDEKVDGFNFTPNDGFYAETVNGKVVYSRVSGEGGNNYDVIYSGCIPCGTGSSYRIDNTTGGTRTGVGTWMPSPATGSVDAVDDSFTYVDKAGLKMFAKAMFLGVGVLKNGTRLLNQFNSVESLIAGAGTLNKVSAGMQGFVKGDGASIFKALTHSATKQANGTYILKDGTILFNHYSTKTRIYTIDINKAGSIYKIRVGQ